MAHHLEEPASSPDCKASSGNTIQSRENRTGRAKVVGCQGSPTNVLSYARHMRSAPSECGPRIVVVLPLVPPASERVFPHTPKILRRSGTALSDKRRPRQADVSPILLLVPTRGPAVRRPASRVQTAANRRPTLSRWNNDCSAPSEGTLGRWFPDRSVWPGLFAAATRVLRL